MVLYISGSKNRSIVNTVPNEHIESKSMQIEWSHGAITPFQIDEKREQEKKSSIYDNFIAECLFYPMMFNIR